MKRGMMRKMIPKKTIDNFWKCGIVIVDFGHEGKVVEPSPCHGEVISECDSRHDRQFWK